MTNKTDDQKALEQYALDNYEEGGHWVYETHGNRDYQDLLDEVGGDLNKAKEQMRAYWKRMNERQRECAWE